MTNEGTDRPAAVVLSAQVTGLATMQGLAKGGVAVHVVSFGKREPVHFSRYCRKVHLPGMANDENRLVPWLTDYVKKQPHRPVVFPTSDAHALMLAKHHDTIAPHCRIWSNSYRDLEPIINKNKLYQLAKAANVETVPSISEPNLKQVEDWSRIHPGPYFCKPSYEGISRCALRSKNMRLPDRASLVRYVAKYGSESLVIQRMLKGGDGNIFDCYGLCDANGRVLTMASHRRWRQHPPDTGSTSFGEIPAISSGFDESALFTNTQRLLGAMRYHGIFGIEWLHEKETGKLYVIDFNARPFTSIGHLTSCGLNLPLLAYKELVGEDLSSLELKPELKHKFWIELLRDLWTFRQRRQNQELGWIDWAGSALQSRSFAHWDLSDPGPGIYMAGKIAVNLLRYEWKKITQ